MNELLEIKKELDNIFSKPVHDETSDSVYWRAATGELRHAILIDVDCQYNDVTLDIVVQEILGLTEAFTKDKSLRLAYVDHLRSDLHRDLNYMFLITDSDMTINTIFDLFEHQVRLLCDEYVIEQDLDFESKLVESLVVNVE